MATEIQRPKTDSLGAWSRRLQNVYGVMKKTLAQVGETEWGWAPDEGIATIRDHALAVVKNADAFIARYTEQTTRTVRSDSVSDARVAILALEKIERRAIERTQAIEATAPNDDADENSERHDLFFAHLVYVVQKLASIQCLQQLIEPSRTPVLA